MFIEARDGPRELEEGCHRRTLASLNNGWLARGGLLRLHDDHLSFTPSPLERLLLAKRLTISFADITAVERHPARWTRRSPEARRRACACSPPRGATTVFHRGLDDWLDSVRSGSTEENAGGSSRGGRLMAAEADGPRPAPAPPARRQAAGGGEGALRTGADLQNGWLARHGDLILTEERLVFVPTLLDTALLAKRRQIMLEDVRRSSASRSPRA